MQIGWNRTKNSIKPRKKNMHTWLTEKNSPTPLHILNSPSLCVIGGVLMSHGETSGGGG